MHLSVPMKSRSKGKNTEGGSRVRGRVGVDPVNQPDLIVSVSESMKKHSYYFGSL